MLHRRDDIGGVPEIIQDQVNGYLVPPSNQKPLSNAILSLLPTTRAGNSFRESGTNQQRFDSDINLKKLVELYNAACINKTSKVKA